MTERSESERAEEDRIDRLRLAAFKSNDASDRQSYFDAASKWFQDRHYRRLAVQDQKPVAWLQSSGTKTIVSQQRLDMDASRYGWTEKPLYLSPPPDAGWDEAIEACKKVAEKWLESFMGGEVYVARSIVNAIEAIRHAAPPDTGAGLPPIDESLHTPELIAELQKPAMQLDAPDHGGADAVVGETPMQRAEKVGHKIFYSGVHAASAFAISAIAEEIERAVDAALSKPAPVAANASAEARLRWALKEAQRFIASVSDISPSVQRRRDSVWTLLDKAISVLPYTAKSEGGLNEQARNPVRLPDGSGDLASAGGIARDDIKDHHRQVGGNSPSDRTSDVMEGWTGQKCPYCKGTGENLSNPMNSGACNKCGGTGDEYAALSTHPHASDKQGWLARDVEAATKRVAEWKNETTKSEGGVEGHARAQVDGRASEKGCISRGGEFTGSASGLLNSPQPEAGIKPGPSDRTADVTVEELADWLLHNLSLDVHPVKDASALLDAFTVGRR